MNQFDKMMLAIRTERVLNEIYEEIDFAAAKGLSSIVFELQSHNLVELAMSVDIALSKNKAIASSEVELMDNVAKIIVTWENDE